MPEPNLPTFELLFLPSGSFGFFSGSFAAFAASFSFESESDDSSYCFFSFS
jgi:hypothetical protein